MLTEVCRYLKNWFDCDRLFDTFTIENGTLMLENHLQQGQYFRIIGSTFNDGIYKYPENNLTDEVFEGAVWLLKLPPDFIDIVSEIEEWTDKNKNIVHSPYQSESFEKYSYTLKSQISSNSGYSWQDEFASRLSMWRKI